MEDATLQTTESELEDSAKPRRWYRTLFGTTFGTATLYLKKPVLPPISEYRNLLLRRNPRRRDDNGEPRRGVEAYAHENERASRVEQERRGSEVRLLRRLRIWEKGNLKPCPIDFGFGGRIALDPVVKIEPVARIRVADAVTMKLLPERVVKISKQLPFHFQGMQAHLRSPSTPEPPSDSSADMKSRLERSESHGGSHLPECSYGRAPTARASASCGSRFEHGSNSGFHFYPGGLEFGDHTISLSEESTAALRVAAGLSFPREYPMHEDHGPQWEIHRLGIKTVW